MKNGMTITELCSALTALEEARMTNPDIAGVLFGSPINFAKLAKLVMAACPIYKMIDSQTEYAKEFASALASLLTEKEEEGKG